MTMLRAFLTDERGATAIEYGLIATLIALAIVGGVGRFADSLQAMWAGSSSEIAQVLGGG